LESIGGPSRALATRDALLRAILRQQFPGRRLPAEDVLARQLGVSRTTVRSALQSLEEHGVVSRVPGRGTTVHERMSPAVIALQRLIGLTDLLAEQGHEVTYEPTFRVTTRVGSIAAAALELPARTRSYVIERVLFADGIPATWAIDVFPASSFVRELEAADATSASSPFEMAPSLFVEPIDHAVVQLLPHMPGKELAAKLRLKRTEPCILLREVHYAESGKALGFSALHVNDRFVRFELIRLRESL
jgi:GntR family transcriptional regulator